jgi:glutamate synthase (NADPH/NADH) large chain
LEFTGSAFAQRVLTDFENEDTHFRKVMPRDYKLVLSVMASAKADGLSEQETSDRVMEAARG